MKKNALLTTLISILLINTIHSQVSFTESSADLNVNANYGFGTFGGGVSFVDFNNDGWDDLSYASQDGDLIRFFVNDHGTYQEVDLGIPISGETKQINWVDIDNDGDKDLFATTPTGNVYLYEQTASLTFVDITTTSLLSISALESWGASWTDFDHNGFLDVFICFRDNSGIVKNALYYNNGDNTFTYSDATAIQEDILDVSFCSALIDYNNDGWIDIYVANDKYLYNNLLYRNNGDGTFTDVSAISGAGISIDAMTTTVADYNSDGWIDIYVTNTFGGNAFLRNNGDGTFTDLAATNGTIFNSVGWGAVFLDADNDQNLDLYVSGMIAMPTIDTLSSAFYYNDGTGNFTIPLNAGFIGDTAESFSNAIGDVNNDGFPEIAVSNRAPGRHFIWKNNGSDNNWLKVDLQGVISNRDGIGAWIRTYSGGSVQHRFTLCGEGYLGQNSNSEFFGLGTNSSIDSVVIDWPSGTHDIHQNIPVNSQITAIEGQSIEYHAYIISNQNPTICDGDTLELSVGNWSNYFWSNGSTDSTAIITQSGDYVVTVLDPFGSFIQADTFSVIVSNPSADLFPTDISCFGADDGSIITQSNTTETYSFYWSSNSFNQDQFDLSAGTYNLTITAVNSGCIHIDSVTINEPSALNLTSSSTPQVGSDHIGTAAVSVNGGTPPYSYFWNDSLAQISDTAKLLSAGYYSVWVVDDNGCSDSTSVFVDQIASINEIHNTLEVAVYPNPNDGQFIVSIATEWTGTKKIEIIDIRGELMLTQQSDKNQIELNSELSSGIYFLQLSAGEFTVVKKISIQ